MMINVKNAKTQVIDKNTIILKGEYEDKYEIELQLTREMCLKLLERMDKFE